MAIDKKNIYSLDKNYTLEKYEFGYILTNKSEEHCRYYSSFMAAIKAYLKTAIHPDKDVVKIMHAIDDLYLKLESLIENMKENGDLPF